MKPRYDAMGNFHYQNGRHRGVIRWMVIRDCSCQGLGQIQSDHDHQVWYPCESCNPNWCRLPFDVKREPRPPKLNTAGIF